MLKTQERWLFRLLGHRLLILMRTKSVLPLECAVRFPSLTVGKQENR